MLKESDDYNLLLYRYTPFFLFFCRMNLYNVLCISPWLPEACQDSGLDPACRGGFWWSVVVWCLPQTERRRNLKGSWDIYDIFEISIHNTLSYNKSWVAFIVVSGRWVTIKARDLLSCHHWGLGSWSYFHAGHAAQSHKDCESIGMFVWRNAVQIMDHEKNETTINCKCHHNQL